MPTVPFQSTYDTCRSNISLTIMALLNGGYTVNSNWGNGAFAPEFACTTIEEALKYIKTNMKKQDV